MWFLILFCSGLIGFYLANANRYFKELARWTKKKLPRTKGKPFNCSFCLSFWLSFACYCSLSKGWLDLILVPVASAVFGFLVELNANQR